MSILVKKIEFESLASKKVLDEESEFYLKVLDEALNKEENKNIAVTGGYGAGKTTIIDSYFEKYEDKNEEMMKVSIATFQSDKNGGSKSSIDHNLLEQQILQQMFFQVPPNKIMNSKFTKISDLSLFYTLGSLFYLLFVAVITISILSGNWLDNFFNSFDGIVNFVVVNWLWLLMVFILIAMNTIALWLLLTFLRRLGISKFGIANTTIEFNFKDGSTVFNHYLDEIIYLFRSTDYKYIVFEDLDRFKDVQIFERLRGLNTTLNRSAHISDRNIKFIYALKDDIFTGNDETESIYNRTKFFDFIIPTVKVMHSSTAESILLKKLKDFLHNEDEEFLDHPKDGEIEPDINQEKSFRIIKINKYSYHVVVKWMLRKETISDDEKEPVDNRRISKILIEDVALFINDMRTLINICNEFEIFRLRLKNSSVTYDNLLAFIVYKNIYPSDYSDLIENKGIVYDVFNKKDKIVKRIEGEVGELKTKKINGLGSIITGKNDIAMLFAKKRNLEKIRIALPNNLSFSTPNYASGGRRYIEEGIKTFEYFLQNDVGGELTIYKNSNAVRKYESPEEFFTIESVNYLDLYKSFDNQLNQKEEEIEAKINKLSKQIQQVEMKSVSRLIKEDNVDLHVNLKDKPLLHLLIRNNWLNESYEDYLTVFREGSISKGENDFIKSIKLGGKTHNLNLQLKNKKKVADKIRVDDIRSIAILNADLIITFLQRRDRHSTNKLNRITSILFQDLENNLDEFLAIFDRLKEESSSDNLIWRFIKAIQENEIDIWLSLEKTSATQEQKEEYIVALLNFGDIYEFYLNPKEKESLVSFIESKMDVRKIVPSEKIFNLLIILNVKFKSISDIQDNQVLYNIEKNDGYEINLNNMKTVLGTENISIEEIKNHELIRSYILQPKNINSLIKNVLIEQEDYNEDESTFIEFIESFIDEDYEIEELNLKSIVRHWSGSINEIEHVNSANFLKILAAENKFSLTWKNIIYYKNKMEVEDEYFDIAQLLSDESSWTNLIENSQKEVQDNYFENNEYQSFVNMILKLDPIDHPKLVDFLSTLNYQVDLQGASAEDNKLFELMINKRVLSWDVNIYNLVELNQLKIDYAKVNFEDGIEDLKSLIKKEKLVWSQDLLEMMEQSKQVGQELSENYIMQNIHLISQEEFISIMEDFKLKYDKRIVQTLIDEGDESNILMLYLIGQLRLGLRDEILKIVNEYKFPWNKEFFQILLEENVDIAKDYIKDHIEKLDEIEFDQNLFEIIIEEIDNTKYIELISNYQDKINVNKDISNKLYELFLSEKNLETLFNKLDEKIFIEVLKNLSLDKSSKLLYKYFNLEKLDREQVFIILSMLNEPFNLIKLNGGSFRISEKHTNIEKFLDFLKTKELKVISSYKSEQQGYVIHNKRK